MCVLRYTCIVFFFRLYKLHACVSIEKRARARLNDNMCLLQRTSENVNSMIQYVYTKNLAWKWFTFDRMFSEGKMLARFIKKFPSVPLSLYGELYRHIGKCFSMHKLCHCSAGSAISALEFQTSYGSRDILVFYFYFNFLEEQGSKRVYLWWVFSTPNRLAKGRIALSKNQKLNNIIVSDHDNNEF